MSNQTLRHFVAAADELHFAHAAAEQGVSRATLIASVKELEAELGYPLFDYSAPTTVLTPAGTALLQKTKIEWAKSAAAARANAPAPGGKAKASKGKGRAPAVKGVRRVGRPRQGR
jgi:DNA-binding transcriptional LysR family regulator